VQAALALLAAQAGVSWRPGAAAAAPALALLAKQVLRYSHDEATPAVFHATDAAGRRQARPVVLGVNYHLDLVWAVPAAAHPLLRGWAAAGRAPAAAPVRVVHRFVVTRDRSNAYAVLAHTTGTLPLAAPAPAAAPPRVWLAADGVWHALAPAPAAAPAPLAAAAAAALGLAPRVGSLPGMVARLAPALPAQLLPGPHVLQRPPPAASGRPLRLLSWNIWNTNGFDGGGHGGGGEYPARLAKLLQQVRQWWWRRRGGLGSGPPTRRRRPDPRGGAGHYRAAGGAARRGARRAAAHAGAGPGRLAPLLLPAGQCGPARAAGPVGRGG
jgi:hypothetical protein